VSVTATGARLLEGAPIAAEIRAGVAADVAAFTAANGRPPGLAIVICGRSAPSMVYLHRIIQACESVGIATRAIDVPGEDAAAQERELGAAIRRLNDDPKVAG